MRMYLWGFVLFLAFTGCTKFGKNISITGFVRNPVTGQAYEGIKIKLMRTDGGLPGGYKDVEAFYTNADGYFEIHHYGAYKSYYLGVDLDKEVYIKGWYEDGVYVGDGRMNVEKGRYMHPVLDLVEYGELNFHIENINCQGPGDTMQFRSKWQFDDDYASWSSIRTGCYNYVSTNPADLPIGYYYYQIKVTRSGITSYEYDTVYVDESGNSLIELFY